MKSILSNLLLGVFLSACILLLNNSALISQVPHPKDVYGFTPGDDYKLATYDQMLDYYKQLDEASDRVVMKEIGKSVLGKPLLLLFISSEENINQLEYYRDISEKLARARIDEQTASQLAATGKAIVWIDGGLHATEVAHGQMTSLLAYRVATEESTEMQKIRENTIMLLMPVMNPDGLDIVASWYEQNQGTPFETTRPPWLYHHYVGHDNNRDWFMNNMPESQAVTQVLYNEWYPQIVYNHHQTGPSWTRIFIPPFADPVNPNIHPGVTTGVNMVGSAMANRFAIKRMPGAVSQVIYSMWWNGGMRTVPYFHNMIGILTETSHATPTPRYYDPDSIPKSIAARRGGGYSTSGINVFYPYPWKGGESHFSDPVSYMITASMATLRLASDLREQWLFNIYQMGRDAIKAAESDGPFAYVIPVEQWNSGEELSLINVLKIGGIEIEQATKDFKVGQTSYSAGSYVIKGAQAFRPYLLDLMEKQEYPDRRVNGQPVPPYDLAGWTLPMQMGIKVDRIEEPFEVKSNPITAAVKSNSGSVQGKADYGYILSNRPNNSIIAVNKLLNNGAEIYRTSEDISNKNDSYHAGSFVITAKGENIRKQIEALSTELGLNFIGINEQPKDLSSLNTPKIGLYKSWVANMDEGWTRWLLENYGFTIDTLHNVDIQEKDLSGYNAIILPHQSANRILNGHRLGTMPEGYTGGLGLEGTLALKNYVARGGTVVALDAASDFVIEQFGLPIRNVVSNTPSKQFFIPGSLVKLDVNTDHSLASGMQPEAAAYFVRSRAFEVVKLSKKGEGGLTELPDGPAPNVEIVASYSKNDVLMSGWALGEKKYIAGKAAMVNVPMGQGNVVLFGFRPQFRGQPRGTYKLFFNSLLDVSKDQMKETINQQD